MRLTAGTPSRLGASWDGRGTNFALFSANAQKVELCLFDGQGRRELERIQLPERSEHVWPGYLINEVLAAKEKGFDVNIVSPSDFGIDFYADTLFTTEKMLKDKPDLVRKFMTATLKGWSDAISAPEDAARTTPLKDD